MTTAVAHPNIALIKYWGKQDKPGNLPATPNLSITLDTLRTQTTVVDHDQDEFWLNGAQLADTKVAAFINALRNRFTLGPIKIDSDNNFPTGAGLASSASGFAALITCLNQHCQLSLSRDLMSDWARRGSASAARSIFSGFVALVPPEWQAQSMAPIGHWPLSTVVAITSIDQKKVSSTIGMERSRTTSPFYRSWLRGSTDDYANASLAIERRDFEQLAAAAELSCLKMHSVMLTSVPTLSYWNATTLACMEQVRVLRGNGTPVFFTIDAGPQVKAICLPEAAPEVASALQSIPGVIETLSCGMGNGAWIHD